MSTCNCASDWRAIPKERRVVLEEPGAVIREGAVVHRDPNKIHVFDRDCPVHGYKEVDNGQRTQPAKPSA